MNTACKPTVPNNKKAHKLNEFSKWQNYLRNIMSEYERRRILMKKIILIDFGMKISATNLTGESS